MKFNREYQLTVDGDIGPHVFTLPTTIQFDITFTLSSTINQATFSITNPSRSSQKDLILDRVYGYVKNRKVVFRAGYVDQEIPVVFRGNVMEAYSERQGSEVITRISAVDGGFGVKNGFVSITRPKEWNFVDIVQSIIKTMPDIAVGTITPHTIPHTRGIMINGNPWDQLQRMADAVGGVAFINKGVANLLSKKGTLVNSGGQLVIEPQTGLLNIPHLQQYMAIAQMLFEPRFDVGNVAQLNSILNPEVNGPYKITGFHHYGTISGVVSGDAMTDFTLQSFKAPDNVIQSPGTL